MRQSFQDAAWQAAMEVVIPSDRTIEKARLGVETMSRTPLDRLVPLVDAKVGQVPLAGALDWSKELLGWRAAWRLAAGGRDHRWSNPEARPCGPELFRPRAPRRLAPSTSVVCRIRARRRVV